MNTKKVELIAEPQEPHFVGDGFRVHNFIPTGYRMDMERMDPFIIIFIQYSKKVVLFTLMCFHPHKI